MNKLNKKMIPAKLSLTIAGETVEIGTELPAAKCSDDAILPFVRELSDKSIEIAVKNNLEPGEKISCSKGCGACCAQLVPISETEIQSINQFIAQQTKTNQKKIKGRFAQAKQMLEKAGLWSMLMAPEKMGMDNRTEFSLEYFAQGVYCPFLEDGACSIHPIRPIACREYLVTSDASNCENPGDGNIDGVTIPTRISSAITILLEDEPEFVSSWVPLIVAPYWKARHPGQVDKRRGSEWIEIFIQKLKKISRSSSN